jgi:hypothetical protein
MRQAVVAATKLTISRLSATAPGNGGDADDDDRDFARTSLA